MLWHSPEGNDNDTFRNTGSSYFVKKTLKCPRDTWQEVREILKRMTGDGEFTSEAAAEVNSLLKAPLLRADLGHGPDGGSFIPDQLLSILEPTAQCSSNVIELKIQTLLPLRVELIGLKMHEDGAGRDCTLGSHKVVSEMLNLLVRCIATPIGTLIYDPKVSHTFAPGEILWCQLKGYHRHKDVALVISKEAAEHEILFKADHISIILVDHRLTGSQQYLLLPAVRRKYVSGIATPCVHGECTMTELNICCDLAQTTLTNIKTFFHRNDGEMSVSLHSHPVQILDTAKTSDFHKRHGNLVPLALGGEEAIAKLKDGITSKPNSDFHGSYPRSDVSNYLHTTSTWDRDIGTPVGFLHTQKPLVYHTPPGYDKFGRDCFWESPPSSSTVIHPGSKWIILHREGQLAEDAEAGEVIDDGDGQGGVPAPSPEAENVSPGSLRRHRRAALAAAQSCQAQQQIPVHGFLQSIGPHGDVTDSFENENVQWHSGYPWDLSNPSDWWSGQWQQQNDVWRMWQGISPYIGGYIEIAAIAPEESFHDTWDSQGKIDDLLNKLAEFDLILIHNDASKLSQKGRGLWGVHATLSQDADLLAQKDAIVDSFNDFGTKLYDTPKLVKFATNKAGKHETVQKLLAVSDPAQKSSLALKLDGQVKYLIRDQFGSLVLQQFLHEAISAVDNNESHQDAEDMIFPKQVVQVLMNDLVASACCPLLVESSIDQQGNHVVQKLVQLMQKLPSEEDRLSNLVQAVGGYVAAIGITQTGCRVLQRILESPISGIVLIPYLLTEATFLELAIHPYGNFVIQHILIQTCRRDGTDKLAVLKYVCWNFESQAAREPDMALSQTDLQEGLAAPDCFFGYHRYARHVVQQLMKMPQDTCPGWSEFCSHIAWVALEEDGSPKRPFMCLREHHEDQVLRGLVKWLKIGGAGCGRSSWQ